MNTIAFRSRLGALIDLSLNDERHSYISLIPFITLGLVFLGRKVIFLDTRYCPAFGIPLMVLGALLSCRTTLLPEFTSGNHELSSPVGGIVLIWIAGFVLIFGLHAVSVASFAFGLFLTIPIPTRALNL